MARPRGTTTECQMLADTLKQLNKVHDVWELQFGARAGHAVDEAEGIIEDLAHGINCTIEIDNRGVYRGRQGPWPRDLR